MSEPPVHPLFTPQGRANPLPIYARLRREEPVSRIVDPYNRVPLWIVTRYQDCIEAVRDPRLTTDLRKLTPAQQEIYLPMMGRIAALNRHMLTTDPPDHTRLRSLVSKAFTPQMVEGLRPRIAEITESLLDKVTARGAMDVIADFSFPLPITVIAELLGIPPEDRDQFRDWTQALLTPPASPEVLDTQEAAAKEFARYLGQLIERRRTEPGRDLVSAMVAAEEAGDRLNGDELLGMSFLLLIAGHETTVNLVANGMLALLQHPDQMDLLRRDPSLMESAVEEMLRYCGPVETSTSRWAIEDLEIAGAKIAAGDMLVLALLSADHDEQRFPEPERFDITRSPNKHIAFGFGMHFCLGAPLARLEGAVAFEALLRRLPDIRLAADAESLPWSPMLLFHAVRRLPITFRPTAPERAPAVA